MMVMMMDDVNLRVLYWPQIISLLYIIITTEVKVVNYSQSC